MKVSQTKLDPVATQGHDTRSNGSRQGNVFGALSHRNAGQPEAVEQATEEHLPAINNENETKAAPEVNPEIECQ